MNDPSRSTADQGRLEEMARSADSDLADHPEQDGLAQTLQLTACEFADNARERYPRLVGQQPGAKAGGDVIVTIVSHELRNALGAIRSATHILRVNTSTC